MARITIVGLGLIGGSLGLALRRARVEHELVGFDANGKAARAAQRRGAIDQAAGDLRSAVADARLVILATPVLAVRGLLAELASLLSTGCVVTDTASTKGVVLRWAEALPPEIAFVGGHPMAGKEVSGIDAADAALFDGAVYCVIPGANTPGEAVETVADLARAVGAQPYFVTADEHDSYVAAISHLPFLLATVLVHSTSTSPGWRDMAALAASGYRDASRLAAGDPVMYHDICVTNREAILQWLDRYADDLARLRALVAQGDTDLEAAFARAAEARRAWERRRTEGAREGQPAIPGFGERLGHLFLGNLERRGTKS